MQHSTILRQLNSAKFILFVFCFLPFHLFAQSFEGILEIKQTSLNDTSFFVYKIKKDRVKIEKLDKNKKIKSYRLINLTDGHIFEINPSRKLYCEIPDKYTLGEKDRLEILKTQNHQSLLQQKCYQWRVKNDTKNTEIAYWVIETGYSFFYKLLTIEDKAEKYSQYFRQIPNSKGALPVLITERSSLRQFRMEIEITKLSTMPINDSEFSLPNNYSEVK